MVRALPVIGTIAVTVTVTKGTAGTADRSKAVAAKLARERAGELVKLAEELEG